MWLLAASPAQASKTVVNSIGANATGVAGGVFNNPRGVSVNRTGNGGVAAGTLYVVDSSNHRIQQFGPTGSFVRAWGGFVQELTVEWVGRGRIDRVRVRRTMLATLPLLVEHVLPLIDEP